MQPRTMQTVIGLDKSAAFTGISPLASRLNLERNRNSPSNPKTVASRFQAKATITDLSAYGADITWTDEVHCRISSGWIKPAIGLWNVEILLSTTLDADAASPWLAEAAVLDEDGLIAHPPARLLVPGHAGPYKWGEAGLQIDIHSGGCSLALAIAPASPASAATTEVTLTGTLVAAA